MPNYLQEEKLITPVDLIQYHFFGAGKGEGFFDCKTRIRKEFESFLAGTFYLLRHRKVLILDISSAK